MKKIHEYFMFSEGEGLSKYRIRQQKCPRKEVY